MHVKKFKPIILSFSLLISTSGLLKADSLDYFLPVNILRFADHLYREHNYQRAAGEYQRYLFSQDILPAHADSIVFRIGQCFRAAGEYDRAIVNYQNIINEYRSERLHDESFYQIALCNYLKGNIEESARMTADMMDIEDSRTKLQVENLRMVNLFEHGKWNEALSVFSSDTDTIINPITLQLMDFANEGLALPHKNPVLAGMYSAVIPGAGKFYCRRPYDGIQSFLTTTLLGWQAYDGFHDDGVGSFKGWIFGTIGSIFYLGNIYGSVVAADIFNEEQEEKLLTKVRVFVNVNFD
jgi:tetratricopeptide (TPR) repeat protein